MPRIEREIVQRTRVISRPYPPVGLMPIKFLPPQIGGSWSSIENHSVAVNNLVALFGTLRSHGGTITALGLWIRGLPLQLKASKNPSRCSIPKQVLAEHITFDAARN